MYTTYKWDEGYSDDVMNDLMVNAQKCEDLLVSMTERDDNIEESVENLNKFLIDLFEKYSKCESKFKEKCENCIQSNKQRIRHMEYLLKCSSNCSIAISLCIRFFILLNFR
jgi:hypothetical protein